MQQSPKASEDELLSDQDKIPHPELDQISSDDEDMSDKEYVPDSESEYDEDYDSDASIPLKSSQARAAHIQVKPVIPDVGTSYGSDTGTLLVPSTSKCWPPLKNKMISSAADTSNSANSIKDPKKKLEDEAVNHEQELPHLIMSKKKLLLCLW